MSQGREGDLAADGQQFAVQSEHVDGGEHIRVEGEMDLSVVGLLDREMERAEATDASKIVLDLDGLEFMDVAGVRLLLRLSARSQNNGRRLRISGRGAPQVQRMLELTGAGKLLPFEA